MIKNILVLMGILLQTQLASAGQAEKLFHSLPASSAVEGKYSIDGIVMEGTVFTERSSSLVNADTFCRRFADQEEGQHMYGCYIKKVTGAAAEELYKSKGMFPDFQMIYANEAVTQLKISETEIIDEPIMVCRKTEKASVADYACYEVIDAEM